MCGHLVPFWSWCTSAALFTAYLIHLIIQASLSSVPLSAIQNYIHCNRFSFNLDYLTLLLPRYLLCAKQLPEPRKLRWRRKFPVRWYWVKAEAKRTIAPDLFWKPTNLEQYGLALSCACCELCEPWISLRISCTETYFAVPLSVSLPCWLC